MTNNYFGHKLVSQAVQYGYDKEAVTGQMANGALAVAHIGVGFLVAALVFRLVVQQVQLLTQPVT